MSKELAVYMFRAETTKSTRKIVEDYLQIVPHIKTEVLEFDNEGKVKSAPCMVMPYIKGQSCIEYINKVLCMIPFPKPCFRCIFYERETNDTEYVYFEFMLSDGVVVRLTKEEYEYLFN